MFLYCCCFEAFYVPSIIMLSGEKILNLNNASREIFYDVYSTIAYPRHIHSLESYPYPTYVRR